MASSGPSFFPLQRVKRRLTGRARVPFTLCLLLVLTLTTLMAGAHLSAITPLWLNRLGYAARDLHAGNLWRMVSTALVTESPRGFYQALLLVALGVGGLEVRRGTLRAAVTFWGVHLGTLLVNAAVFAFVPALESVAQARDVGPSAGYFGCLAAFLASLGRWGHVLNGLMFASLLSVFALSLIDRPPAGELATLSANLAHVVAYALGWGAGVAFNQKRKIERAL